ncbi:MAG: hypothetical protein HY774_24690 [Acidobacteria bacterium]|nr:hypothetical protein [Acidobacteriota bacterium]
MSLASRTSILDWNTAQSIGKEIVVGNIFAFLTPKTWEHPTLGWIARLLAGSGVVPPRVVSLAGTHPIQLGGAEIKPFTLPDLNLAVVTCDKAIYRTEHDTVNLLALNPLAPRSSANLVVSVDEREFSRHTVQLGDHGEATFQLRDLPVGSYEAAFEGTAADTAGCSFTVAEYRLSPLTAAFHHKKFSGNNQFSFVLNLESFGTPVEGDVALELMEQNRRLAKITARAEQGKVKGSFALTGNGPHTINVQLVADPGKTATLPIVGSRASERQSTAFSKLGTEISGSLLPVEGSRLVRGIFLEEGAQSTSPFALERVDTYRARLTVLGRVQALTVLVIDPTFPKPRPDAVNPETAPYPGATDEPYQRGEALFKDGYFSDSVAIFERARAQFEKPHPFYAYFAACCYARQGQKARAVAALRQSIEDGWTDFHHLATDEDLKSLQGYEPYEWLKARGIREFTYAEITRTTTLEFEMPGPVGLLAIGAFVNEKPWEGWAATLAPVELSPEILLPLQCEPGTDITIHVTTETLNPSALYMIVKDARLLSGDTPLGRLAGGIKTFVETTGKELMVGTPEKTLAYLAQSYGTEKLYRAGIPNPPPVISQAMPPFMPMPQARPAPAPPGGMMHTGQFQTMTSDVFEDIGTATLMAGAESGAEPDSEPAGLQKEPEVLFAGLVPVVQGKASLTLLLPDVFADYIVEAFVISGLDWEATESRFQAKKDPYLSFSLPAFVHPEDTAIGHLNFGATAGNVQVQVRCNGVPVPLAFGGKALQPDEVLEVQSGEVTFLTGPGVYTATLQQLSTESIETARQQVDAPGVFRRLTRSLVFLEPGNSLSRTEDIGILSMRILPGLDKPFTALVEATADYGHACCEQTAAKLLAACGMYALANGNSSQREKAEAIILAGIRREESMWLPGRGFKMYPESPNSPHDYYGPKAARYLFNLDLLRTGNNVSKPLSQGIEKGLKMATDAAKAYRLDWPLETAKSSEEAYNVMRFNLDNTVQGKALDYVRKRVSEGKITDLPMNPYCYGAVLERSESAYAAATLFRSGGGTDWHQALKLANTIVNQLNDQGSLYSTVDSVAAIALMAELKAARVIGNSATVKINRREIPTAQAIELAEEIESIEAVDGVVAVEVTRLVEENWSTFDAGLPLRISLEKNGRPGRQFVVGDAIDLRVKLEGGYKTGDLLWVCLPESLSRLIGGGQVKLFSLDFREKDELVVPLAATSITVDSQGNIAPQHFAVCVRNMFEEERAGSPGLLTVTVTPADTGLGTSLVSRALRALRDLI